MKRICMLILFPALFLPVSCQPQPVAAPAKLTHTAVQTVQERKTSITIDPEPGSLDPTTSASILVTSASISVADLNRIRVLGIFGQKLGTAFEIEATVVSGDATRAKANAGIYLLKITRVRGTSVTEPKLWRFSKSPGCDVTFYENHSELIKRIEVMQDEPKKGISQKQIEDIEKSFVGKQFKLQVYETGHFSGTPENLPKGFGGWADHRFNFMTNLIVLGEVSPPARPE